MKRSSWLDAVTERHELAAGRNDLLRQALFRLDDILYEAWNLGGNLIVAWTRSGRELRFLAVKHYAILEHGSDAVPAGGHDARLADPQAFVCDILAGRKFASPAAFGSICAAFGETGSVRTFELDAQVKPDVELIERLVARYSVSLVRERAVVLLDAVGFSLRSPLEQVAMLNSLSYSVNSAYSQLRSNDIDVNFARSTTGDGFYIWNRARTRDANVELYKLMMMILADNAVAQRRARQFPVPRLRAAFHVGEHYEFYQVEGLNPTSYGYIVGQVTIDLARFLEKALPGQILLGEFGSGPPGSRPGDSMPGGTIGFVAQTADALDQLNGMVIAGDRVERIRCYLTGEASADGEAFHVNRYELRDKHGFVHPVYNAKINIFPRGAEALFLGIQHQQIHPPGSQLAVWP